MLFPRYALSLIITVWMALPATAQVAAPVAAPVAAQEAAQQAAQKAGADKPVSPADTARTESVVASPIAASAGDAVKDAPPAADSGAAASIAPAPAVGQGGESGEVTSLQKVKVTGKKKPSYNAEISSAASKTAIPLKELPQSVSTVTKELMVDKQAFRINDIIKNVSGVNLNNFENRFTIRGIGGNSYYLINGLRVSGRSFSSPLTGNLEKVEVVKGPASAGPFLSRMEA